MKIKGTKNLLMAAAAVSAIGVCASTALAQNISTVEGQASSTAASLSDNPVITAVLSQPGTVDGRSYTSWSFLVQDGTGSLDVFYSSTASSYVPVVGNTVSINGNYSPFDGIPEIANSTAHPLSITTVGTASVPSPAVVTIPQINATTEVNNLINTPYAGYYIQLDNVTITGAPAVWPTAGANGTYTVTDGANSMVLFDWTTSYSTDGALGGTTIPTGPVDLDGFVDFFATSSEAEFIPTSVISVPEPASMSMFAIGAIMTGVFCYRLRKKA